MIPYIGFDLEVATIAIRHVDLLLTTLYAAEEAYASEGKWADAADKAEELKSHLERIASGALDSRQRLITESNDAVLPAKGSEENPPW